MRCGKQIWSVLLLTAMMVLVLSGCGCEHKWVEATCTEAKKCTLCEKIEGEPLGHTAGEWKDGSVDVLACTLEMELSCQDCGTVLEKRTDELKSFHNGNVFLFSVEQYAERLNDVLADTTGGRMTAEIDKSDGNLYCNVFLDSAFSAATAFGTADGTTRIDNADSGIQRCLTLFAPQDNDDVIKTACAIIMTCDPILDEGEAIEVFGKVLNAVESFGTYERNGIVYKLTLTEDSKFAFIASLA